MIADCTSGGNPVLLLVTIPRFPAMPNDTGDLIVRQFGVLLAEQIPVHHCACRNTISRRIQTHATVDRVFQPRLIKQFPQFLAP